MTIRDIIIALGFDVDQSSKSKAEQEISSLKNMAQKVLGTIGISISIAGVTSAIKDCVALASEVEEMQNKFDVVFQGMTDEVEEWAQTYADSIGRNANDIKSYLADQQNLLVGFGMTREEGAALSKEMTSLALDLASFANLDETTAVNAMTKAVMGESEAAKTLGAVLNDTTRAEAMQTLGLSGKYDALDQLTKMQVNYQAILSQSPDAIGDCERSLGSYQSTLKQFNAKLKELKTIIGQFFMPTAQWTLSIGTKLITKLRDLAQKVSDLAEKLGGADKVIRTVAAAAATIFIAFNFGKIISGLSTVLKLLITIGPKVTAIATAVLLVALIVEDFVEFMKGNNSVIGTWLEQAGVDCDALRKKISSVWESIKGVISTVGESIQKIASSIFSVIRLLWDENGDDIKEKVVGTVTKIADKLQDLSGWIDEHRDTIVNLSGKILALVAAYMSASSIFSKLSGVFKGLGSSAGGISKIFGSLKGGSKDAGGAVAGIGKVFSLLKGKSKDAAGAVGDAAKSAEGAIKGAAKGAGKSASGLGSKFKIAAVAVAGTVVVLKDLFNFANGEDSLLGSLAEKLGMDTEGMKENIRGLMKKFQEIVPAIKEFAKGLGSQLMESVKKILPRLIELGKSVLPVIVNLVVSLASFIGELAVAILPVIMSLIEQLVPFLLQIVEAILPVICGFIEALLPLVLQIIDTVLPIILDMIDQLVPFLLQIVEAILPVILDVIEALLPFLAEIIEALLPAFVDLITAVLPILEPVFEIIASLAEAMLPAIVDLLDAILPILEPILSILGPIADILGVIIEAISKVVGWVSSGLGWIVDKIFGGETDTSATEAVNAYAGGTDYSADTFVAGEKGPELITGQRGKKVFTAAETGNIFATLGALSGEYARAGKAGIQTLFGEFGNLSALQTVNTVNPYTVSMAGGGSSNVSRNVTQNVNISNQFNGDRAGQEKSSIAMDRASEDATSEMARALAFARG